MSDAPIKAKAIIRKLPYLALCLCAMYILFCCRMIVTDGPSMEPTYSPGDLLLCVRTFSQPQTGDVVLIETDGKLVLKRVTYIAGDTVADPSWYYSSGGDYCLDSSGVTYWDSDIVPEGYVYVTGDNPDNSHDSRYEDFGLVPIDRIWGKVAFSN